MIFSKTTTAAATVAAATAAATTTTSTTAATTKTTTATTTATKTKTTIIPKKVELLIRFLSHYGYRGFSIFPWGCLRGLQTFRGSLRPRTKLIPK